MAVAKASDRSTFVHIHSDPLVYGPDGDGWWDVPVPEVSTLASTQRARVEYLTQQAHQKPLLG
jgi:3D-(3,5/4)-trihydroxycyclohexane-1,2-dione acylhydrolase (decyclizing)